MQPKAFFLPAKPPATGQRFCLHYPAQGDVHRGQVIYIHPFAEEMNKARRMAALQARALSRAGFSVLQIDLLGCGDSSGDFGDATWQSWVNDVVHACHWLRDKNHPHAEKSPLPLWLWGLRAGCLVAVEAANQLDQPCHFLFWQPASAGKLVLQQFLRLKVAADLIGGQSKGVMEAMRQQLADGVGIEIAGYLLSPGLAAGLERSTLEPATHGAPDPARQIEWMETSTRDDASLSPASIQGIARWQQAGFAVNSQVVKGPAFWQTTEIEDAPALIEATTAALIRAAA